MKKSQIKIVGIIPARGGSKGIPHKNIIPLHGKPLIYYTIRAAQQSKLLDTFMVSTDDPAIARVAKKYKADVPFLRPKRLAGDKSKDIDFLAHALQWLQKNRGWDPDIIVILQPTSPFRTGKDIDNVLTFMHRHKCESIRTIIDPSPYNPFKMWTLPHGKSGRMKALLPTTNYRKLGTDVPRQMLPRYYLQVGLIYATKAKYIKGGRVWGSKVCGFIMPKEKFVDIDTYKDLKIAEQNFKNYSNNF
ncbi:MAG: acylneuraminate cytidylyltransferase family protein [Candidatus Harrisonbacteria bacterium]|nr:acylneuraminate cytidylyltransferase family protein [Candidatus Harrisonbacteria bacterium]